MTVKMAGLGLSALPDKTSEASNAMLIRTVTEAILAHSTEQSQMIGGW